MCNKNIVKNLMRRSGVALTSILKFSGNKSRDCFVEIYGLQSTRPSLPSIERQSATKNGCKLQKCV